MSKGGGRVSRRAAHQMDDTLSRELGSLRTRVIRFVRWAPLRPNKWAVYEARQDSCCLGTPKFQEVLKDEIEQRAVEELPLSQALRYGNYVADEDPR